MVGVRSWLRRLVTAALVGVLLLLIVLGAWQVYAYVQAEDHIRKAEQALRIPRYREAYTHLNAALRFRPRSAHLHILAGRTARQVGEFALAQRHLGHARRCQNSVTEELQLEEAMLQAQLGEVDATSEILAPYIVANRPEAPLVLEAMAAGCLATYRLGWARDALEHWLRLEPNNVQARFRRGLWFAIRGEDLAARADYRKALEGDPERFDIRVCLAENLLLGNRLAEATEEYRTALEKVPGNVPAQLGFAKCLRLRGELDQAQKILDTVSEQDETNLACWVEQGLLAQARDRPEEAERWLQKVLRVKPGDREACYNLVLCLNRLGKREAVAEMSKRLTQIEADWDRVGELQTVKLGKAPRDPALQVELGTLYLRLGEPNRGAFWLTQALKLDPNNPTAHERLADYYEGLGEEGRENARTRRQRAELPQR
jgi:tetratricopeptide (TPR) repeat protein